MSGVSGPAACWTWSGWRPRPASTRTSCPGGQQQRVALARALAIELQAGGQVTVLGGTVPVRGHVPDETAVDVLVRPEDLHMEIVANGNGIVTTRTFLGSVTRVGVQLSGDVAVRVDRPSAESAALSPGESVSVSLPPGQPVLVSPRRVS